MIKAGVKIEKISITILIITTIACHSAKDKSNDKDCIELTDCMPGEYVVRKGDCQTDNECAPCEEGLTTLAPNSPSCFVDNTRISISRNYMCANGESGEPKCWGSFYGYPIDGFIHIVPFPPEGVAFKQLTNSNDIICGIRADNDFIECWGSYYYHIDDYIKPPEKTPFLQVIASGSCFYGLRADNQRIETWGIEGCVDYDMPLDISFSQISPTHYFENSVCGIRTDNSFLECWGYRYKNDPDYPKTTPLKALAKNQSCAIRADNGFAECWGDNRHGQATPPENIAFSQITGYEKITCGIREDKNELLCWGEYDDIASSPAKGIGFSQVVVSNNNICGIRKDNKEALCWSMIDNTLSITTPNGPFLYLVSYLNTICGRKADTNKVECWHEKMQRKDMKCSFMQEDKRAESIFDMTFSQISVGLNHACAITTDSKALCFGNNDHGQLNVKEEVEFLQVTAGALFSCGIRADNGFAECWGDNSHGQATPPDDIAFVNIVCGNNPSGENHACGLKADGTAICWGSNTYGQASPPEGVSFSKLTAGYNRTCGLRADNGYAMCWGNIQRMIFSNDIAFDDIELDQYTLSGILSETKQLQYTDNTGEIKTSDFKVEKVYVGNDLHAHDVVCAKKYNSQSFICIGIVTTAYWTPDSGSSESWNPALVLMNSFSQISMRNLCMCGIREKDNLLACWEINKGKPPM